MAEARRPLKVKNWVAYAMFAAIIVVFVFFGITPDNFGGGAGGVAAVVNNEPISIAEFRQRAENAEASLRGRFDQFPPEQRQMFAREMRKRALDELIFGELMYQEAKHKGILAVDQEVRDYILEIPVLKENGRFQRQRYEGLMANMRMTPTEFEKQVRKQLVGQKLQDLFMSSVRPSELEVQKLQQLKATKINLKVTSFSQEDLQKAGFFSERDVQAFAAKPENSKEIEKYFADNKVQFSTPEQVQARHILLAVNDKRTEQEALKQIADLKAKTTPANFAQIAKEHSDDPGSKVKGGELPPFSHGAMTPAFEKVAFELAPGTISNPVKTEFGYHLILVEKKVPAKSPELAEVRTEIARRLMARQQGQALIEKINGMLAAGQAREVENMLAKAGLKPLETGEFDLSSTSIPKVGESRALVGAVMGHKGGPGYLKSVVSDQGQYFLVNVTVWKEAPPKAEDAEAVRRSLAYRKSAELVEAWAKNVEATANIERNPLVLQ